MISSQIPPSRARRVPVPWSLSGGCTMSRRIVFACLLTFIALGCSRFDTTREEIPRGTLGEEIVRVFCERMASEANPDDVMGLAWKPVCRGDVPPPEGAPPRMIVLMENRERLAGAL